MHISNIAIHQKKFPTTDFYPFNLELFQNTTSLNFHVPVTFFIGENGTGKSTLLKAIAQACGVHIWEAPERSRYNYNQYENFLYSTLDINWNNGNIPGSYFASQTFRHFAQNLDEWASMDPKLLEYFGGNSLMAMSHGQSLMAFFKSRYERKGLYFLDEPETALSPKSQIEFLQSLTHFTKKGQVQFIIATHSPILMACPNATIYTFDDNNISTINYKQTQYYKVYRDFMINTETFLKSV